MKSAAIVAISLCACLGVTPAMALGESFGASSGGFSKAVFVSRKAASVEARVTCKSFEGCSNGALQIYASPRQAKILRKPKVKCGGVHHGSITCTVVRPAKAVFTRCKPSIGSITELWNTEQSVPEWESELLNYGIKETALRPPVERVYSFGPVPQGTSTVTARVPLKYGTVQDCLYLVSRSAFELIKENCLPEFKEEVRKELCGKESATTVKVLGGTSIKSG